MNNLQEYTASLEDLLVKEFRSLQSLVALTREEHSALKNADAPSLLPLVEDKEVLLDEIGHLEDSRRMITEDLAREIGLKTENLTMADLLAKMSSDVSSRLTRLHEGILTLVDQARELGNANRILATSSLEWLDATQVFLLSLYQPQFEGYQPPGKASSSEGDAVWGVERRA